MRGRRGSIQVIVHAARQLAVADFNFFRTPSSDPYCIVALGAQNFRTPTVYESLDPTWEHTGSLLIGSFLPSVILHLLGESEVHQFEEADAEDTLQFDVFDEDLMSGDDALGTCSLSLRDVFARPDEWFQFELKLSLAGNSSGGGALTVSVCWEPAPFLLPYVSRLVSVICFAASFALLFSAAQCRWQPPALEAGELRQPGVAAALLLGCGAMLLAAALHFVLAHSSGHGRTDDLTAAQDASQGLSDALLAYGVPGRRPTSASPTILVDARARGMMSYELSVSVTDQLTKIAHLPIVISAWWLPLKGMSLAALALLLQFSQALSLRIHAGQVLAITGVFAAALGTAIAMCAETGPAAKRQARKLKMLRHAAMTKSKENFPEGGARIMPSGVRRRDFVSSQFADCVEDLGQVCMLFGTCQLLGRRPQI